MNSINGELPTWQEKKALLYDKSLSVDQSFLIEMGNRLFQAGRRLDALEFYHRAVNEEGSEKVRAVAVDEGNIFLYRRWATLLTKPEAQEDLVKLAQNAERLGKYSYARTTYKALGDDAREQEMSDRLRDLLPNAHLLFEELES